MESACVSVCVTERDRIQFPSVLLPPLGHLFVRLARSRQAVLESTVCERLTVIISKIVIDVLMLWITSGDVHDSGGISWQGGS